MKWVLIAKFHGHMEWHQMRVVVPSKCLSDSTANFERASGERCSHELERGVDETIFNSVIRAGHINAESNSWIEAAHGNTATRVCTSDDHEPNGKAIKLVLA